MNRDIAQLIAVWINDGDTLYSFALVSKATAAGVRHITPIKQLEFELRRRNELREGMIDGFRSLLIVGSKAAEYSFRPSLQLDGPNSSFSQNVIKVFETDSGKQLLGAFVDKYIENQAYQFSPEVQCLLIMLIPFWVRLTQTI